jgi:hypothetical protein
MTQLDVGLNVTSGELSRYYVIEPRQVSVVLCHNFLL